MIDAKGGYKEKTRNIEAKNQSRMITALIVPSCPFSILGKAITLRIPFTG